MLKFLPKPFLFQTKTNATWLTLDVNMCAITLKEVSTAIAEQDSNLKLIKWDVKVKCAIVN